MTQFNIENPITNSGDTVMTCMGCNKQIGLRYKVNTLGEIWHPNHICHSFVKIKRTAKRIDIFLLKNVGWFLYPAKSHVINK
jgi:hypothetical protein